MLIPLAISSVPCSAPVVLLCFVQIFSSKQIDGDDDDGLSNYQ